MAKKTKLEPMVEEYQTFSTRRLEALTDGVFAIAMTLLVLDLKVDGLAEVSSSRELWTVLSSQLNGLSSFIISFLLLGSMWAVHTRQFEYITRSDRHLTTLNTIRLLIVVLIPLTTGIASRYQDLVLGRVLLPINFFALAAISYWQWTYAVNPKNRLQNKISDHMRFFSDVRNRTILYLSLCVVIGSIFIGELAFLILIPLPIIERYVVKHRI